MTREKLLVEQKSEELIKEVERLLKRVRQPCSASIHLEKAAVSTHLNIGEGTALYRPRLKANKYDIARGEANESRRALQALVLQGKLNNEETAAADKLADSIIAMLTTMIKNWNCVNNPRPPLAHAHPSPTPTPRPDTLPSTSPTPTPPT